jgi:glycine cleavage system H protein
MTTRYTRDHEWIRLEGDTATIGISEYAQEQLGDIVFVELPAIGKKLAKGDEAAVVESVKAASEIFAPVGGEVVAVNEALADAPGTVNEHPEGAGWFIKLKVDNTTDFEALMDGEAYAAFVETVSD